MWYDNNCKFQHEARAAATPCLGKIGDGLAPDMPIDAGAADAKLGERRGAQA